MIETRVDAVVTTVPTVPPDATIGEAARRLAEADAPALIVQRGGGEGDGSDAVVGVVTPSNFVALVAEAWAAGDGERDAGDDAADADADGGYGLRGVDAPVASIADPPAAILAPETPVREAAARMCRHGTCHAPVVVGGTVRGLVTPETLAPYVPRTRLPVEGPGDGRGGSGSGSGSGDGDGTDTDGGGLAVAGPPGAGDD